MNLYRDNRVILLGMIDAECEGLVSEGKYCPSAASEPVSVQALIPPRVSLTAGVTVHNLESHLLALDAAVRETYPLSGEVRSRLVAMASLCVLWAERCLGKVEETEAIRP